MLPEFSGERHLKYWAARLHRQDFVYVIQEKHGTPIKIGTAREPRKRLATLQTGNPDELRFLYVVPGDFKLEYEFHDKLRDCHIRGEWFEGDGVEPFLRWLAKYADEEVAHFEQTRTLRINPNVVSVRFDNPLPDTEHGPMPANRRCRYCPTILNRYNESRVCHLCWLKSLPPSERGAA